MSIEEQDQELPLNLRRENFAEDVEPFEEHWLHMVQSVGEVNHGREEDNNIDEESAHITSWHTCG